MGYFGLNPSQENDLLDRAARTPGTGPTPGVFEGSLTAIPEGIASGALKTVAPIVAETTDENFNPLLSAMSPTPFAIPEAPPAPEVSPEEWAKQRRAATASTLAAFKPDPKTTGFVGQLLHGVADVGSRFVAGQALGGPVGGAVLAGGTETYAASIELQAQGVDPSTATTAGAVQGVAVGIGGLLPAGIGGSLIARLGTGAAGNVAIGAVSRGTTSAVLADAGYAKQAEQYKWLDAQAVAIDLVLGAGFGGLSHITRAAPSEVDAALTGNESLHVETATAPGVPTTTAARSAHVGNQARAAKALYADEPVTGLADVEVVRSPEAEAVRAEVRTALDEVYPDAAPPRAEQRVDAATRARVDAMSPAERDAEIAYLRQENQRLTNELGTDPLTGLGNRRAFEQAEPAPLQVMMDVDSLKYVNDTMGHEAGDAYLQAVGEAMRRAEVPQGYRLGGDEFAFQARTEAEATAIRERIDRELQGVTVEAILPDGTVMTKTGVGVSYGMGADRAAADRALYQNKADRTAAGQRGERGAEPPGISRRAAERDTGAVRAETLAPWEVELGRFRDAPPLRDMSLDELDAHAERVHNLGRMIEDVILGERAGAWRSAQRDSNSANDRVSDAGSARLAEIEATLRPDEVDALYASGDKFPEQAFDDAQDFRDAASQALVDNADEAAREMGWTLAKFAGVEKGSDPATWTRPQQVAYAKMRGLQERILDRGWDSREIQRRALAIAASRYKNAGDAEAMLGFFLRPRAANDAAASAIEGPAPRRLSFDRGTESTGGKTETGESTALADPLTPEAAATIPAQVDAAAQIVADNPGLMIALDDGRTVPAAELLAEADAAAKAAEADAGLFDVAVTCFLGNGS